MTGCSHLDTVEILEVPDPVAGCEECLASGGSGSICACARAAATSAAATTRPNRHATAHNAETGHPIIRSVEPGEDWSWCYVDELMFRLRPREPGPARA